MISKDNYTHAWVYTNIQDAVATTGVTAAVILCFSTQPESRIALWHAKDKDGNWKFMTPTFGISPKAGEKQIPCLFGKLSDDLTALAQGVQAKLKEVLTKQGKKVDYGRVYKVTGDTVEEMA